MRIPTIACSLFLFAMTGCDLSEADRMDITRAKVVGVAPIVQGVEFFGRRQISIDTLLTLAPGLPPQSVWTVLASDSGVPKFNYGKVRGWWRDSLIFDATVTEGGSWSISPAGGEWMRHPDQLREEVDLYSITSSCNWCTPSQTVAYPPIWIASPNFLQDFNELRWDSTFSRLSPRSGDTLRLKVGVDRGSPGRSDSMPVFADYTGLRTLGNYVTYLKANDTATLSWVVTAVAGDTISLDLGWGTLGESQSFGFRVKR
jgi:hypothetical protein